MSGPVYERLDNRPSTWSKIPDTLRSLWQGCLSASKGADVARALTANLVGITTKDRADELREVTERLCRSTPSRAFLLVLDDDAERAAELSATTRCHGSYRDIVLEEIVVRLPRRDLARVPGLLRPLMIDDLPSHLWWPLPWPGDEGELDRLAELCRHVIVDSRGFGNPARELAAIGRRRQRGQRVTDLAWLRLQPWRRALAEAFTRFPWRPGATVTGTIRHGRASRSAALLLADWLHERLHASVALEPDGDAAAHGPQHVALAMSGVEVAVELGDGRLVVHVTTDEHCWLPFTVQAQRSADRDVLARAIDAG